MTPTEPTKPTEAPAPRLGRLAVGLLISIAQPRPIVSRNRPAGDPQPCIVCGNLHVGNNAFCSADCCRTYKAKK